MTQEHKALDIFLTVVNRWQRRLTVLSVQQDFKAVGLIVVERLPDFVDGLLVRQLSIHETEKEKGDMRKSTDECWLFFVCRWSRAAS